MSALAIIPARGGSKGLPRKNLRQLAGKPLIVWSIEHALRSKAIDTCLVSTDCPEIAETARRAGAYVPFLRPAELASDTAATEPVMLHALLAMEQDG
ncbi:MAG: acylneuraminate cytidylyltransferase family protein, partial [Pseudomonadota bacterium]